MIQNHELRRSDGDEKSRVGVMLTSDNDVPEQEPHPDTENALSPFHGVTTGLLWHALFAFKIGSNWTSACLGPLKNTIRNELGVTNAQFGVVSSADSFINSIFPIVGGMTLDWWGPNKTTICCTTIIFVDASVAAGAVHLESWRMLAAGHVLMGLGVAILDQAQQKVGIFASFVYHWFGAGGLAFASGLENAVSSTVGMVAGMPLTRDRRERLEAEIEDRDIHPLTKREVRKPWVIYTLLILVAMIATA
ncbi:MFS transporter [Colletotrichum higginsianum IMI 349063]|uniref:MFS transporter n=1 Tax=Colletotrichum higginsianum (strain IMI 349063) TaxID=759273 RepID=A0A1B7YC34_COLHI|nr:MFS transporter [Colletotrichum higginsianum IMI 349063]OBR09642.1 MFS transporter [Colletotrichum higginsianum IMI 349063]